MSDAARPAATIGGEAAQARGADRALALVLRGVLATLGRVPRGAYRALTAALYGLALPFTRTSRAWLFRNVQHVYGLPRHSGFARAFARQVLSHQIVALLETARAMHRPDDIRFAGVERLADVLTEAQAANKGIILVTAHIGSWELMGWNVARVLADRFYVLAKPSKAPALTAVMDALRARFGMKVLWTDRKTLLRDMLAVLRQGGCLGFVMDQKPAGRVGPVVDFMGTPTAFVNGPAQLTAKTGCPVVGVFCLREGVRRYRIISRMLLPADHGEADHVALTQVMAGEIERVVRLYPEQWAWNYKRWRFES